MLKLEWAVLVVTLVILSSANAIEVHRSHQVIILEGRVTTQIIASLENYAVIINQPFQNDERGLGFLVQDRILTSWLKDKRVNQVYQVSQSFLNNAVIENLDNIEPFHIEDGQSLSNPDPLQMIHVKESIRIEDKEGRMPSVFNTSTIVFNSYGQYNYRSSNGDFYRTINPQKGGNVVAVFKFQEMVAFLDKDNRLKLMPMTQLTQIEEQLMVLDAFESKVISSSRDRREANGEVESQKLEARKQKWHEQLMAAQEKQEKEEDWKRPAIKFINALMLYKPT